jgi:hypothetical protein
VRRRGRYIQRGANYGPSEGHSTPPSSQARKPEVKPPNREVPEEWRRYAREPWHNAFPNLDWKPPEID